MLSNCCLKETQTDDCKTKDLTRLLCFTATFVLLAYFIVWKRKCSDEEISGGKVSKTAAYQEAIKPQQASSASNLK